MSWENVKLRKGKSLIQQSINLHVMNVTQYVSPLQGSLAIRTVLLVHLSQVMISTTLEIT